MGFFSTKMAPEGPVEIDMEMEILRSAQDVYPMLDFNDHRNHQAAVGRITRTADSQFDLELDLLPDITFPIREVEAVPGKSYTIESIMPEGLGRLERTIERATVTPLGEGRCKLRVETEAWFHPMKLKFYDEEVAMITMACHNSLSKVKIFAEEGVEVIREIEEVQKLA